MNSSASARIERAGCRRAVSQRASARGSPRCRVAAPRDARSASAGVLTGKRSSSASTSWRPSPSLRFAAEAVIEEPVARFAGWQLGERKIEIGERRRRPLAHDVRELGDDVPVAEAERIEQVIRVRGFVPVTMSLVSVLGS